VAPRASAAPQAAAVRDRGALGGAGGICFKAAESVCFRDETARASASKQNAFDDFVVS
jgi:hypothetical protein